MSVTKIDDIIDRWKKDDKPDMAERAAIFKDLAGVESIEEGLVEYFWGHDEYVELLTGLAATTTPDVRIADITGRADGRAWTFDCTVNGNPHTFTFDGPSSDFLDKDFVAAVSEVLAPYTSRKFRHVQALGVEHYDMVYYIAFIEDNTYEALLTHPLQFAGHPSYEN